ncbi:MAG: tetratricopeptide repeat protein [Myxococcota bacterium]
MAVGVDPAASREPDAAPRSTVAVLTFEAPDDDAALCQAHRWSDLLAERLGQVVEPRWAVLSRTQVRRRETRIAAPGEIPSAQLPNAAKALSASVVIGGRVEDGELGLHVYDVRKGRRAELPTTEVGAGAPEQTLGFLVDAVLSKTELLRRAGEEPGGVVDYPTSPEACAAMAKARKHFDRSSTRAMDKGLRFAKAATKAAPDSPRALAFHSELLSRFERSDEALPLARSAVEAAPGLAQAHWALGLAHDLQGQTAEAIEAYGTAAELDAGFGDLRTNHGMLLLGEGRLREALATLREALELDRGSIIARINLAIAYVAAGDGSGAFTTLEPVPDGSDYDPHVRLAKAQALNRLGRVDQALSVLEPILGLNALGLEARYEKGLGELVAGRFEEAERTFASVLEADRLPSDTAARTRVAQARALAALGRLEEARVLYGQVIDADEDWSFPVARRGLALLDVREGSPEDAVTLLEEVTRRDPRDHEAWFDLGTLHQDAERWEDAEAAYRTATDLNPRASWALHNLGLVLLAQGRRDEAVVALREAAAIDPRSGRTANLLGAALWRAGEADEALATWRGFVARATKTIPNLPVPDALTAHLAAAEAALDR